MPGIHRMPGNIRLIFINILNGRVSLLEVFLFPAAIQRSSRDMSVSGSVRAVFHGNVITEGRSEQRQRCGRSVRRESHDKCFIHRFGSRNGNLGRFATGSVSASEVLLNITNRQTGSCLIENGIQGTQKDGG
jgi:hypothetical protein